MGNLDVKECDRDTLSPREKRQNAIVDAAYTLFLEQGYERTSLAEIVKRSGGSLATLYELFGSKQGLLRAIATRWRDEAMAMPIKGLMETPQSNIGILIGYAHRQSDKMTSPCAVALMRMLISESLRDREFAEQIYQDLHLPAIRELTDLFSRWTAAGEAEIEEPEAAARLFLSLIAGDGMMNALAGVEDQWLSAEQIAWRLQPFISHFGVR